LWINLALEIFERRDVSGLFAREALFASVVVGQALRHSAIQEDAASGRSPVLQPTKGRIKKCCCTAHILPVAGCIPR
jgi:hypothetical protein